MEMANVGVVHTFGEVQQEHQQNWNANHTFVVAWFNQSASLMDWSILKLYSCRHLNSLLEDSVLQMSCNNSERNYKYETTDQT